MSAGGIMFIAGFGSAAGVYAANVFADEANLHGDPINVAAIGGGIGAAIGTLIGIMVTTADKKVSGTVSGLYENPMFP